MNNDVYIIINMYKDRNWNFKWIVYVYWWYDVSVVRMWMVNYRFFFIENVWY